MYIHVVKSRETLWSIAQQYNVRVSQIIAVNGLISPNQLVIGQSLFIPPAYSRYTIQTGDSLQKIANRYGTTVPALLRVNQIANPALVYPGQKVWIPIQSDMSTKPSIEVNAFTTRFGATGAQDVREVAPDLTFVSPFGYRMKADGGIASVDDDATLQEAILRGVKPMMVITNFSSTDPGTSLAHTVLSSPSVQDVLLNNVIGVMQSKGYVGLNVDFENVAPTDRELYNNFLQRTVNRLHAQGYFVSSSLAPKTSANQPGLLYEAHDYPAHGRILDFVVLMTYEWGYRLGPPQAISPLNQIDRVLDYAVSVIPRNKILMGFQVYARDWLLPHVQGMQAETFDMQEALRRAIQYGANIQYDTIAQSPYYTYIDAAGRAHEVWFEDARSAQAKFNTVKIYGLRGISYWVLGYPFPVNWAMLNENFTILQ